MKRASLSLALLLAACGPPSQILLYVDTDAPVPAAADAPIDPTRPPPLFDRLRIAILRDGQPIDGGTRDFAIDDEQFRAQRVSVGIAPDLGDNLSARVQLFRGDRLRDGVPPKGSTLSTVVALPSPSERIELTAHLHVADVGQALGESSPIVADAGPPSASEVGSWPGANVVPCSGAPHPSEVCIPGGAFWFGDPAMRFTLTGVITPTDERLVVVSPFFLQTQEVTVGAFRKKWATLGGMFKPTDRDPTQDPRSPATWCTWSELPGGVEDLPINCLAQPTAELYCEKIGGTLPSEAQLEFVASGRGRELAYPWGNDEPTCGDAVWGRGRGGGIGSAANNADDTCRPSADLGGCEKAGSGLLDRASLVDPTSQTAVEILDLAGNLSEWARDMWSELDEPYWSGTGVLTDPVADQSSNEDPEFLYTVRGGNWTHTPYQLRAAYREGSPPAVSYGVGFRCAR